MQIANDVHKLLALTELYLQINQGYLFSMTKDLDHPCCKDMMGNHSQRDFPPEGNQRVLGDYADGPDVYRQGPDRHGLQHL